MGFDVVAWSPANHPRSGTDRPFRIPPPVRVIPPADTAGSGLVANVVVVHRVAGNVVHVDLVEAGLSEHLPSLLNAPHRPEPDTVVGQRDGHAMLTRNRVHEGSERMV